MSLIIIATIFLLGVNAQEENTKQNLQEQKQEEQQKPEVDKEELPENVENTNNAEVSDKVFYGEITSVNVEGEGEKEAGTIVALDGDKFVVSTRKAQNVLIGVVAETPIAEVEPLDLPQGARFSGNGDNTKLALVGVASVKVSSVNGNIKVGDYVTSSDKAGVGMLAESEGYVLGTALEKYDSDNPDEIGFIKVSLNVHLKEPKLDITGNPAVDIFRLAVLSMYEQPRQALKYLIALILGISGLAYVFTSIGKNIRLSIIAIGRNPLASKKIYRGMFLNILFSFIYFAFAGGVIFIVLYYG